MESSIVKKGREERVVSKEENLCMGCMNPLDAKGNCTYCNYQDKRYESPSYCLPPHTYLKQGDYLVGRVLGQGGFGITYLGFDTNLLCPVAIKEYFPAGTAVRDVTKEESFDVHAYGAETQKDFEKGLQAFIAEARLLAKFKEIDGVVKVHQFFQENQTAYIVMEYVDGFSVKQYIKKAGKILEEEVSAMMRQAMSVLQAVHEQNFVYRDVSVDNFMINREGKLILIDFGAARYTNALDDKTRTMMCKQGFSAIEQYSSGGKQGAWTDVYGICATMYYMLTGIIPKNSTERVLRDEVIPLTEMENISLKEEQKQAIMKGMSVDIENRYQSMSELYHAFFDEELVERNSTLLKDMKLRADTPQITGENAKATFSKLQYMETSKKRTYGMFFGTLLSKTAIDKELNDLSKKRKQRYRRFCVILLASILGVLCIAGVSVLSWKNASRTYSTEGKSNEKEMDITATASAIPIASASPQALPAKTPEIRKIEMPSVIGFTKKEAIAVLKKSGLKYKISYKKTNQILDGYVVRQSVQPQKMVKETKTVTIYISKNTKKTSTQKATNQPTTTKTPKQNSSDMDGDIDSALQ